MSNTLRITGMASGLDVDSVVKQMMSPYNTRINKLRQDRQIVSWRQQLYRDTMGDLNTFKSTFFDVIKPDYMLSSKNFSNFDVKSSDTTNAVTGKASSGAIAGNYTISVAQLAEYAKIQSSNEVNAKEAISGLNFPIQIDSNNDVLTVNGKTVDTLASKTYSSITELAIEINNKLSTTVDGAGKLIDSVQATIKDGKIQFVNKINITDANKNLKLSVNGNNYDLALDNTGNFPLSSMVSQINSKLSTLKDSNGVAFPSGTTAALSNDGLSIEFKDGSGTVIPGAKAFYSDGITEINTTSAAVSSENANPGLGTYSIPSGSGTSSLSYGMKIFSGINDTLTATLGDGTVKNIDLSNILSGVASTDIGILTDADLTKISENLTTAFSNAGLSSVTVSKSQSGKLLFSSSSSNQVTFTGSGVGTLGLKSGFQINQSSNNLMSSLVDGYVKFSVNNVSFEYDFSSSTNSGSIVGGKNMSISSVLDDIESKAGINFNYSELTRKFTLASQTTGAAQIITNTNDTSGDFLKTLLGQNKISNAEGYMYDSVAGDYSNTVKFQGKDAQVTITEPNSDPVTVFQSTNNFTVDGVSYTLNSKPAGAVNLTLTANPTATYDKVKNFVDKYNELIDKINDKIDEKRDYDYVPLTDDQKKDMSDDDIKAWEEKAKQGLLGHDSTLGNMLSSLRRAFFDTVKVNSSDSSGIGISLSDIGLTTSSDYTQRGKIIIDETKLKDAIANKGDKVTELLTRTSTNYPSYSADMTSTDRTNRYSEEGIFQRINDVLSDNLRTVRDSNGNKGILLEKAGIKGDYTEYHNYFTDDLDSRDKTINTLLDKISDKEEYYYLQFSKLEQAMQQMNSQSSWLSQQLGSMSSSS